MHVKENFKVDIPVVYLFIGLPMVNPCLFLLSNTPFTGNPRLCDCAPVVHSGDPPGVKMAAE